MSAATRAPAAMSRTASVTAAPALSRARAVSTPMPDAPPVTIARLQRRSTPATTSAAVDSNPNGVRIVELILSHLVHSSRGGRTCGRPCLDDRANRLPVAGWLSCANVHAVEQVHQRHGEHEGRTLSIVAVLGDAGPRLVGHRVGSVGQPSHLLRELQRGAL